jgi:cysteinyl-tRNA synthetase
MLKLYNTLSRQKEDFKPIHPPKVTFYSCGPTVYDYPHIGNWFTFIRYDLFNRVLRANDFDVEWVMNITDVGHLTSDSDEGEDKLEEGAKREGATAWEIAQKYSDYFEAGFERLNMSHPQHLPRATDHIPEQIKLIEELETKGFTYQIDDGVYFDTAKFKDYGKLGNIDIEGLKAGARVEANPQKRNHTDFALWKFSPKDQQRDMEWDSPWGKGFPGWHLECSAMSMKYLGETIDIHAGGIDHIAVHHNDEIAQSEGATGQPFANYWLHTNFILVDGKKMAKSAGNFYTLEDIEERGIDLMAFRLLALESHYRTEAQFSWDNLQAAQNRLVSLRNYVARNQAAEQMGIAQKHDQLVIEEFKLLVTEALRDDFGSPQALAAISKLEAVPLLHGVVEAVAWADQVFGLDLVQKVVPFTDDEKDLFKQRKLARESKDYTEADAIRNKLMLVGIETEDIASQTLYWRAAS